METQTEDKKEMGIYEGMMRGAYAQLIFYKNDGRQPTQHLLNDIEGYEQILESDYPDENALTFFKAKRNKLYGDVEFKDNIEIVNKIKDSGDWK